MRKLFDIQHAGSFYLGIPLGDMHFPKVKTPGVLFCESLSALPTSYTLRLYTGSACETYLFLFLFFTTAELLVVDFVLMNELCDHPNNFVLPPHEKCTHTKH